MGVKKKKTNQELLKTFRVFTLPGFLDKPTVMAGEDTQTSLWDGKETDACVSSHLTLDKHVRIINSEEKLSPNTVLSTEQ